MENLFRDAAAGGDLPGAEEGSQAGMEGMVPVLENLLGKLLSKEVGIFMGVSGCTFLLSCSEYQKKSYPVPDREGNLI